MTDIKKAIAHYEYGISHDIFKEPVLTYTKAAVAALRAQLPKPPKEDFAVLAEKVAYPPLFRLCGGTWEYCDGNCADCLRRQYTTSDRTEGKMDKFEPIIAYFQGAISDIQEYDVAMEMDEHTIPYLNAALDALEAQRDSGWISVKDRLPPNYVPVLGYIPALAESKYQKVYECYVGADGEWHSSGAREYRVHISHWMPLPKPPNGYCSFGKQKEGDGSGC